MDPLTGTRHSVSGAAIATTSFADLAEELRSLAMEQAFGVEALELFAARSGEPAFNTVLERARLSARRAGELHALLIALAPHEAEVRALCGNASLTIISDGL